MNDKKFKTLQAGEEKTNKVFSVNTDCSIQTAEFAVKALLARCLSEPDVLLRVTREVTPEMIANPRLRFVYEAVKTLADKGDRADLTSVSLEMMNMDEQRYGEMGDIGKILNVDDVLPLPYDDSDRYIYVLKNDYWQRQLKEVFQTALLKDDHEEMMDYVDEQMLHIRKGSAPMKEAKSAYECGLEMLEGFKSRRETGKDNMRVLTHIEGLDKALGGLYNGEVTVLAGKPGDGKSAVALNIAVNAALADKKVCYFNLEMSEWQTMLRVVARFGNVDSKRLRIWGPSPEDEDEIARVLETLKDRPLYFYDIEQSSTVAKIHAAVKMRRRGEGCDLVVIDHLHEFSEGASRSETETVRLGKIMRAIKNIARTEEVPVLLLSQLNRNVQTHTATAKNDMGETITVTLPPTLSNLRASGDIESVADNVIFIYHPKKNNMLRNEAGEPYNDCDGLFCIEKARNCQPTTVRFVRTHNFSTVADYEEAKREMQSRDEQSRRGGQNG